MARIISPFIHTIENLMIMGLQTFIKSYHMSHCQWVQLVQHQSTSRLLLSYDGLLVPPYNLPGGEMPIYNQCPWWEPEVYRKRSSLGENETLQFKSGGYILKVRRTGEAVTLYLTGKS